EWMPLALTFDNNDNLYVVDVLKQHQVIVFEKSGKLKLKFGGMAAVSKKGDNPGKFYYPNGICIDNENNIFVADSNNRRVQVFSAEGKFLYIIETGGLPRGIAVDKRSRLYVVDALGHDISVFKKTDRQAQALTVFGGQGVEFGQFLYPNSLAIDKSGSKIVVTDRENNRLQSFVWPSMAAAVSEPTKRALPYISFLFLLGLLLATMLMRRRRYYVSKEFLSKVIARQQLSSLARVKGKLFLHPDTYEKFKNYSEGDIVLGDIVRPISADNQIKESFLVNYKLDQEAASIFAAAEKGWVKPRILTEDDLSHKLAAKIGIETMDFQLFMEYYAN
ncbi:MAG: 6-bladed beta-propeller, partial [Rubrobacteridae bacterium]|nr:6-bladed beta-propeller [Rubrobacteridae bacterium]